MNSSIYGPFTKEGIDVQVYMIAFEIWAYQAERGTMYTRGKVNADNRIDAWNKAFDEAKIELSVTAPMR